MLVVVTDRRRCADDFPKRLEAIASARPGMVILREKDMAVEDYTAFAAQCRDICGAYGVPFAVHTHLSAARTLHISHIHFPMPVLRAHAGEYGGMHVGASVHSAAEAVEAARLGAAYVTAGHVFATGCKPDIPPRGLSFLREVCGAVDIPVYAIGGMLAARVAEARACGAAGICVMSALMSCRDPHGETLRLLSALGGKEQ